MSNCCKKVVYLSCLEHGSKVKGAGFIKVECREGKWIFDMHISGMSECPERKYEICAVDKGGGEYGIGSVFLHRGSGEWKWGGKSGELGSREIPCDKIVGFVVKISENKVIEGKWQGMEMEAGEKTAGIGSERRADVRESRWWKPGKPEFMAAEKWNGEEKSSRLPGMPISEEKREGNKGALGRRISLMERRGEGQYRENDNGKRDMSSLMLEGRGEDDSKKREYSKLKEDGWTENRGEEEARQEEKKKRLEEKKRWEEREQEEGRQVENRFLGGRKREVYERAGGRTKDEGKGAGRREKGVRMEEMILNDKWEQLRQMYPVVHPYEDEREYISIQPKDFVIMTGDYQHLANNSFLLHGFYNYRHIVLGREPRDEDVAETVEDDRNRSRGIGQRSETDKGNNGMEGAGSDDAKGCFYLGVPGVYYEREKMVALMFGFEAFECCGGKAESGKFGYYLRRVRI